MTKSKINEIKNIDVKIVEETKNFVVYEDDTAEDGGQNLSVNYCIIKQGLTRVGKKVPTGEIMVLDGDDILFNGDEIEGVLIYPMFGRMHRGSDGETPCFAIRDAHTNNMNIGTSGRSCRNCPYGSFVQGQVPECPTTITLYMLVNLDGYKIIQVKVKGAAYKYMRNAFTTIKSKIRGKFFGNTVKLKTKEVTGGKKDSSFYVWDLEVGGPLTNTSVTLSESLKELRKTISGYWINRYSSASENAKLATATAFDVQELPKAPNAEFDEDNTPGEPQLVPETPEKEATPENVVSEDDIPF